MVLLVLNQVTDKQDVKWIYFLHIKPAILRQRVRDSDHMVEHIYFLQGLLRLVLDEFAIVVFCCPIVNNIAVSLKRITGVP